MGNKQSNDDFSKNPNFNIQQHQQAMTQLQANYSNTDYRLQGAGFAPPRVQVTETEFKSVRRTASIYKPSIDLVLVNRFSILSTTESDSTLNI